MSVLIWVVVVGVILIAIVAFSSAMNKAEEEQQKLVSKISEDCKQQGIKKAQRYKEQFREKYSELGEPSTEVCFHKQISGDRGAITRAQYFEYGWTCNSITVWEAKKTFLMLGEQNPYKGNPFPLSIQKPLPFDSLVSCETVDDAQIIRGNGESITRTSKLGMISRGIVGGALFGGVGALAGAMTANTTTSTSFNEDIVRHNYKIHLTLNDFTCPLLTLEFGESEIQMRQVLAILNLIIKNS